MVGKRDKIVMWAIIACIIVVILLNIFAFKNQDFWKTSVTSCLTLFVALYFGFLLVQRNQKDEKQKEIYMKVLEKFQLLIVTEDLYQITDSTDINLLLMKKRAMNNYLDVLQENAAQYGVQEEISFIREKTEEYADLLGNHQTDIEYLKQSKLELKRPLMLIDTELSKTMMKVFE